MKQTIALLSLYFVVSPSLPTHAQEGKAISTVDIPSDAVNQKCEIVLDSTTSASMETNSGKIARFDNESVVLVDASRTVRVEKSAPILGSIPYLGRLFRNIGIGVEEVPGELSVDRRKIKSVKFTK
jgi:hypothetical protein